VLASVFVLLSLIHLGAILSGIYRDSDAAVAPVLATLAPHAPPGSTVVLGQHAWYEDFLVLLATRWLPLHRQLWLILPIVWCGAGLGLLAWTIRRAFGSWEACVAIAALVCVGAPGRHYLLTWDAHSITVLHTVVLAAVLVWLSSNVGRLSNRTLIVGAVALGLLDSLPAASDMLIVFWGLIPFAMAAAAIAWCGFGWGLLTFAVVSGTVALVGGAAIDSLMRANHIDGFALNYHFVLADQLWSNISVFLQSLTWLADGDFFGSLVERAAAPIFISGVLVLVAVVSVLLVVRRRAGRLVESGRESATGVVRLGYITFWTGTLVIGVLAYVGTSAAVNVATSRYLLGPYVAIAALLPVLTVAADGSRRIGSRLALALAVALFAITADYELQRHPSEQSTAPSPGQADALAAFARAHRVARGYASYWASTELMWAERFRVALYPIHDCTSTGSQLCRDNIGEISSWYQPRPRIRSMVVIAPGAPGLTTVDPELGRPLTTATVDGLTVDVYPYDIASRLH
jgi:hypothetical protein